MPPQDHRHRGVMNVLHGSSMIATAASLSLIFHLSRDETA